MYKKDQHDMPIVYDKIVHSMMLAVKISRPVQIGPWTSIQTESFIDDHRMRSEELTSPASRFCNTAQACNTAARNYKTGLRRGIEYGHCENNPPRDMLALFLNIPRHEFIYESPVSIAIATKENLYFASVSAW